MSWGDDVESSDEEESSEEEEESVDFSVQFEKAVRGADSITDISELEMVKNLDQVDNEELLREGWLEASGEKKNLIKKRLHELDASVPTDEGEQSTLDEQSESDESDEGSESEDDQELPDDIKRQQAVNDIESNVDDSDSDGWGGEEGADDDESPEEEQEPAVESVAEMSEGEDADEGEPADTGAESDGGPPTPASSVGPEVAAQWENQWKILCWGPPKLFKTHMGFTMPEPIAFIDLEGKSDDIAQKFTDVEVQIWQPKRMEAQPDTKFRRAKKALDEALEWLEWYWEEQGERGTIVVDSMSLLWEWAQRHHKLENYPMKDPEDIELSANFQSSQESDWAVVKEYHNGEFRERVTDSPFHFYWTAMQRQDIQRQIDEDRSVQLYEPKGEPDNDYKADTIVIAREDSERGKVGDLDGSNRTDNNFVGLKKPTFPKVRDAINAIAQAESTDEAVDRSQLASDIGAQAVIDHDPQMFIQ